MTTRILTEIWIYPVKSIGGFRVRTACVKEKGLEGDRRWMLIDKNNVFFTQRDFPTLSLFKTEKSNNTFRIRHGKDSIELPPTSGLTGSLVEAQVWDDMVSVKVAEQEYNKWFSDRLGIECKLVWFPEECERRVDPNYDRENRNVSLADGYPLLIIGQASLDDLNGRLSDPVPMNRFRPNFVFKGGEPYEEDTWSSFRVGGNRFQAVKKCARCVTTTVNQDTGEKGREPLLTLSRYRRNGENIYFGQNVLAIDHNEIHEGDEIAFD